MEGSDYSLFNVAFLYVPGRIEASVGDPQTKLRGGAEGRRLGMVNAKICFQFRSRSLNNGLNNFNKSILYVPSFLKAPTSSFEMTSAADMETTTWCQET